MAPIAEAVFMPFMTDGKGADWIGGWFGTGPERGLALMFTLAGLIGVTVTFLARVSRSFRQLDSTPGSSWVGTSDHQAPPAQRVAVEAAA